MHALTVMLVACADDKGPIMDASPATETGSASDGAPDGPMDVSDTAFDSGVSGDVGSADLGQVDSPESDPRDSADDRPTLPGVTCVTKRRVPQEGGCTQSVTTEPDVGFRLTPAFFGAHPESAMGTDSPGIRLFYNRSDDFLPVFVATDSTRTLYKGTDAGPNRDGGTARRTGDRVDFTMNAARAGVFPTGCMLPLVEVTCSGSTWLRR